MQVAGKVRATLSPVEPGWGQAPFYLSARGATTSPIPLGDGAFEIRFDFVDHSVSVLFTDGRADRLELVPRTVAAFHSELLGLLAAAGVEVEISAGPSDVEDGIPFAEDTVHATLRAGVGEPLLAGADRGTRCPGRAPSCFRRAGDAGPALVGVARPRLQPVRSRRARRGLLAGRSRPPEPGVLRLHVAEAGRDQGRGRRAARRGVERRAGRVPASVRRRAHRGRSAGGTPRVPRVGLPRGAEAD